MKIFPESALVQLEFNKVQALLEAHCKTEYARKRVEELRIHTRKDFIDLELQQSHEFKLIQLTGQYFPNDYILNISRELKLLGIPGATLAGDQFIQIRKLADSIRNLFRWFTPDTRQAYPHLFKVLEPTHYEKKIIESIDEVLEETGIVRDDASDDLARIRMSLYRKRNELRRTFDRIIQKWTKAGYVADIEEAFLNGRRVVAVHAEYKRQVKGILLGESDTRKTAFIEPMKAEKFNGFFVN